MSRKKRQEAYVEEVSPIESAKTFEVEPREKYRRVLTMIDGTEYEVIDENWKFYFCKGGVQFRKENKNIAKVR